MMYSSTTGSIRLIQRVQNSSFVPLPRGFVNHGEKGFYSSHCQCATHWGHMSHLQSGSCQVIYALKVEFANISSASRTARKITKII